MKKNKIEIFEILEIFFKIIIIGIVLIVVFKPSFDQQFHDNKISKIPENIRNEVILKEIYNKNILKIKKEFEDFENKIISNKNEFNGYRYYFRKKNKYTFYYVVKEDNIEKGIYVSKYQQEIQDEKEIKKEFILKNKEGFNIDYYISEYYYYRTNQYTFKKIILDVGNNEVKECIFKNQDFNQYLKEINYNKIKEEIEKEFIENNEMLKQYNLEVEEK